MGRLRVAVLGAPEVRHNERVVSFPTRKTLALLLYLAVEGRAQPREVVAALLWPESDAERSRGSLRGTLAYLRAALAAEDAEPAPGARDHAPHLLAARHQLGLADLELDLHAFQSAFTLARSSARLPLEQVVAQLRAAVALYRGDFLAGFSVDDAPGFEEWASAQRELWHRRAEAVFNRLSQEVLDGGEVVEAREVAARWVQVDPLNETAQRRLIQAHLAAGDRAAALRAYDACCALLAAELEAEPAPETAALAALARSTAWPGGSALAPAKADDASSRAAGDGALVGRLDEHASLAAAYRAARRGGIQVVTIEGEPGIGKTRLAREFVRWAGAQGATILHGRAYETGGQLPYHPLVEALRGQVERENAPDDLLSDVWLSELSRLLPELRERYPDLPAPVPTGEAEARLRLFEAIARYGRALSERAPLVLFIDDLHWADTGTYEALPYALRSWTTAQLPILMLLGVRSDEVALHARLAAWLADLQRTMPVLRLCLGPLTPLETLRLAQSLAAGLNLAPFDDAPQRPDEPDHWLFTETGGHPLMIVETVRALSEQPDHIADGRRDESAPGVRAVIQARLDRLGPATRRAIAAGAVLGDGWDFTHLQQVAGLEDEACLDAVEELLARRLLRESGSHYVFAHDKIREVTYAAASTARRRVLHQRALETLTQAGAPAAMLARHALAAELAEPAYRCSVAAGDEALRLFAVRDAIEHYTRAREMASQAGVVRDRERDPGEREAGPEDLSHLYAQLGRAYTLADQYDQARTAYEALLALAQERDELRLVCAALNRLADVAAHTLDFAAQAALLRQALDAAEASHDDAALVDTLWNLGQLSFFLSDFATARTHHERALALARDQGLDALVARSLSWMAIAELLQGRWDEAYGHADEARRINVALGNRAMESENLSQLAGAQIRLGHPQDGVATARAGYALSTEIAYHWGQAANAMELALGLTDCGAYAEALSVAEEGVAAARISGYLPLVALNLTQVGCIHRMLGQVDVALRAHREALTVAEATHFPAFIELAASELCADHVLDGEWAQAAAAARQALAARREDVHYAGLHRWYESEALLHGGEVTTAEDDLQRFGARVGSNRRYRIPYLRGLAMVAQWRGDTALAIEHLRDAAALADAIDLPGEAWEIAAELARLCGIRGDEKQASRHRERAREIVQTLALGMPEGKLREGFLAYATTQAASCAFDAC